jgi:EAL and modified HD-GYP domain-containing signal transduction protein
LFSHLDKVMNKPMSECIEDILIADEVRDALLGERNGLREVLDCVVEFEQANWDKLDKGCKLLYENNVMAHYIEAIQWATEVKMIGVGSCQ